MPAKTTFFVSSLPLPTLSLLLVVSLAAFGPLPSAAAQQAATRTANPAPNLDSLIARLAEAEARLEDRSEAISFTITARIEELDRKGKVEAVHESVERVRTVDGKSESELIRASTDGKDRTEEERKERAEARAKEKRKKADGDGGEGKKKRSVSVGISSPFGADARNQYRYALAGRDPSGPDRWRIRFEPKGKPTPELQTGEAIVDVSAGKVIRVTQHPAKNPRFVDRMDTVMEFDPANPVGPVPSKMTIEGEGGILFIKKQIRATTTFSDWKVEEASPSGK